MTDTLETLTVADVERKKLQKHFGRFDILFFLVCTIVGVDTIATVAQGGGEAFTWMMIFAVVFFVPQALLFSELGTAFPQEGGPYYWTRLAFGHLAGAVNNFLYWITNPVWIGGTLAISCIGAVEVFFNNGNTVPTPVFYIIALAFVWVSIVAAITSFSVGKWVPTAGAFARFLLLAMFMHHRHRLRGQARRPRAGRGELLADGGRLRAPGRRAAVQLRRLRAAEQRGRGDDQPAARRAVRHRPLHRGQRGPLRAAGGRHPDRAAGHRRSPTSAGSSAPSSRSSPCTAGTSRPTARPR